VLNYFKGFGGTLSFFLFIFTLIELDCFASFSKQAKAFRAEEYFTQDDFDKEEFMSCE
jgi:hypothetical protein